ncbi:SPOR domain-containing protein [Alistipes sp. ZOR0009]|uniref:SPOR domain-containing protein n=1 Tax=Alistipes sp. ZOR0009 TaxID=1339253 RepID=UPI00064750BE|nr:SPOR domain-containing protein [Alistipes sp. ZOR0009]
MNISHYIQELLFSKQQVALPNIGTFEFVSKPAHIDSATGTITPPSKTIKFRFNEDSGHSVLASFIAKKCNISASKAIEEVNEFSNQILETLGKGNEFELDGIGVLRMLGSGSIIFLPISTYSSLGESFGLPTINLQTQAEKAVPQEKKADISSPEITEFEIEDSFELIEDSAEISKVEEMEEAIPVETFGTKEEVAEAKEPEKSSAATSEKIEEPFKAESRAAAIKAAEPEVILEIPGSKDDEIPVERSKNSWIWMFLIVICVLAIAFVALYHYKPSLFSFLSWNDTTKIEEPQIPTDSDTSYYKAITGTLDDTATINDSARLDSARANLQKIDSISKSGAKPSPKPTIKDGKTRRMTKEEVESIINEKLKLGNTVKTSDTQPKAASSRPVNDAKATTKQAAQTKPAAAQVQTGGNYNVIAASVRTQGEVQREVARLKAKGFTPQIIDNGSGKIRISIGAYPNSRQAATAARNAKSKLGVDAWVLNP